MYTIRKIKNKNSYQIKDKTGKIVKICSSRKSADKYVNNMMGGTNGIKFPSNNLEVNVPNKPDNFKILGSNKNLRNIRKLNKLELLKELKDLENHKPEQVIASTGKRTPTMDEMVSVPRSFITNLIKSLI